MNNKFELFPESNLVDLYLPERYYFLIIFYIFIYWNLFIKTSNTGIIFVDNTSINIFDKKPTDDYVFVTEELKKRNINTILVSLSEVIKSFKDSNKNHEAFIETLEKNYSNELFYFFNS